MRRVWLAFALLMLSGGRAWTVEGPTAAGPVGGNDIRAAELPPPGLYFGNLIGWGQGDKIVDGSGRMLPGTEGADLKRGLVAPFVAYVPAWQLAGGSVALTALLPGGRSCGTLSSNAAPECFSALGDLYLEAGWSRRFGAWRAAHEGGIGWPVFEGLTLLVGLGIILPTGRYDSALTSRSGAVIGTNVFDVAPTLALTYTTAPLLLQGTELSLKTYLNMYSDNPETGYRSGDLLSLDFALTERWSRYQFGLAGTYSLQLDDDTWQGRSISPDGNRLEVLTLGGVVNVDLPEYSAALRLKAVSTIHVENSVESWGITIAWIKQH